MASESIAELAPPRDDSLAAMVDKTGWGPNDIDATDITLDADRLGLGKKIEYTNPALDADRNVNMLPTASPGFGGDGQVGGLTDRELGLPPGTRNKLQGQQERFTAQGAQDAKENRARINEDQDRYRKAYDAQVLGPDDLKPWDVEGERRKWAYDPFEAFGSVGSVFAILAAAFTKTPFTNAMNGAASAMNSLKEGKEKEFERDFDAFKVNTDLAIKRHNIMRQQYDDAIKLFDTDVHAAKAKMAIAAAQFGDEQTLAYMHAGLDSKLFELLDGRSKAMVGVERARIELTADRFKEQGLKLALDEINQNPQAQQAPMIKAAMQLNAYKKLYGDSEEQDVAKFLEEGLKAGKEKTAEEIAKFRHDRRFATSRGTGTLDSEFSKKWWEQHPEGTAEQFAAAVGEFKKGQKPPSAIKPPTASGDKATWLRERAEELQAQAQQAGKELSKTQAYAQAEREHAQNTAPGITGNKRLQEEAHITKFNEALRTIHETEGLIRKKLGPVGVPGYATRLGERLSNFLGSKSTEYVEVQHNIQLLKAWASENLLDRQGRPLSTEASNLNAIIAGLNIGDTVANTLKQYEKLASLYERLRDAGSERLRGGTPMPGTPASTTPTSGKPANRWESAPLKGD